MRKEERGLKPNPPVVTASRRSSVARRFSPKQSMKRNPQKIEAQCAGWRVVNHEIGLRRPPDMTTDVLWVVIPYTSPELTEAALRHAGACTDLNVHVSLVDIQVVPFPCPLDHPPID